MIGDRIKEARIKLGYSAEQVASFLGVSPATVYRYEKGDISKVPSEYLLPLAQFLNVSIGWLVGFDNETDSNKDFQDRMEFFLEKSVKDGKILLAVVPDETSLIYAYRSLSPRGKQLLLERAEELKLLYGKKSEDHSTQSV